jgi:DNA-directed RNA polymerase subunit beta'
MAVQHVQDLLAGLDLDQLRQKAYEQIRSGKKTHRAQGVKTLRAVEGLQRSGIDPRDLIIKKVPVVPAGFRPFTVAGETFIPGDANELYSDLIRAATSYKESAAEFGPAGAKEAGRYLRSAVRAVYGYDDSPNPKLKARSVSGFLSKILGSGPKTSWVMSKLSAKPQDYVGRGVISPDPDLGMDDIGIPEEMAWTLYQPYIQRRLISQGYPSAKALRLIRDRDTTVKSHLLQEMRERPVIYTRAPAWHKFNVVSGNPRIVDGDNIKISPFVSAGHNADYDGDTMSIHVPSLPEAVKDAKERIRPSNMLFSIRSRDSTLPVPKHEQLLGLAASNLRPSGKVAEFDTEDDALKAYDSGDLKLEDQYVIKNKGGPPGL